MVVAKENPDPNMYVQESDCLDTWFSSGLWPFSTMGFPNSETDDFKKFYPTSVLVTGFDIIFFWVARMITMGLEFTGKAPFKDVYIHGLIRDEKGQKMSKSKGNTIDPVEIIEKYGCDALRFTMTSLCTYGGQDIKISDERFEYGRNFANKLWNASRFVLMNLEGVDDKPIDKSKLTLVDKWILNQLNETAKLVNENMKDYRIGEIAHVLYDFFRSEYCDWYVEIAKIQLQDNELKANTQRVLRYVLDMSLRLFHPIMPHITEQVWQVIKSIGLSAEVDKPSALIIAEYPTYKEELSYPTEAEEMKMVFDTITSLRNVRQSFNIPTSATVDVEIRSEGREKEIFNSIESYIHRLAKVNNITYAELNAPVPPKSATAVVSTSKLIVPLADLIDLDAEIKRQEKKLDKLRNEKNGLLGRMKNEKFVANAPKELVEQTNARIEEITAQEQVITDLIESLK
jgi:valyl-tRNA synthetase